MIGRYSNLKAIRFPENIRTIRDGLTTPPVHVQMVLSDLCNQSCSFCSYRDPGYMSSQLFHVEGNYNPNRQLPTEKAFEIIDDVAAMGGKAIQFTGGGEPTVHRDFGMIANHALHRGLKFGLITNGVLLGRFDVSKASWIRISVDAATPRTYARIRRVPEWHFQRALDAIRKHGCGAGFVVTSDNWKEVLDAVQLFKSLGASNVRIAPEFTAAGQRPIYYAQARELVRAALAEATDTFKVFSRFEDKTEEVARAPEHALCGYQYFTTYVGADQNLYRCCVYAYNPHGLLGSVKGRRFRDVWEEIWPSFRTFDARKCSGCHYQDINRSLAYALAPDAPDEEFV